MGTGSFKDRNCIIVSGEKEQEVQVDKVVIATGSQPIVLPEGVLDVDERNVVTSTGALELGQVPEKMAVIGAGVIGLELGSVYARLGTDVTVLESADRICPQLDKEISRELKKILEKQGLKFLLNTEFIEGENLQ